MREKDVFGILTLNVKNFDVIGLLPTNRSIAYITIALTGVCKETFDVNSKITQTMQNIWNFIVRKSNLQEMAKLVDYPGDFRL